MRAAALLTAGCILLAGHTRATPRPGQADDKVLEFTGQIEAKTVDVRPRVTGYLTRITAKEGAAVKAGDLLAEIDPRAAKIEVEIAKAKLIQAEAKVRLAEARQARTKQLTGAAVITKEELVQADTEVEVARAEVALAKAELELAELHLSWTKLTAPVDGRLGRFHVTEGNLVRADGEPLVTLVRTDPLHVAFDVDERTALKLREQAGKGGKFAVAVGIATDEGYPRTAELDFTDNAVDPKTGTIRYRATLPNPKGELLPGLFARVRLTPQPVR
jgi:RND family efflux transporter MFP subunit